MRQAISLHDIPNHHQNHNANPPLPKGPCPSSERPRLAQMGATSEHPAPVASASLQPACLMSVLR